MLSWVELHNWRAHRDTRIPLGDLTLLVGANGGGKSSVLEALYCVGRPFEKAASEIFTGPRATPWVRRVNADGPAWVRVGMPELGEGSFSIEIVPGTPTDKLVARSVVDGRERTYSPTTLREGSDRVWPDELPAAVGELVSTALLRLSPTRLALRSSHDAESLAPDGYGLATVLAEMKLNETERFNELLRAAREVVPSLLDLSFGRAEESLPKPMSRREGAQEVWFVEFERVALRELLLTFADAPALPAHAASEGTLLVLGILTALFQPKRPRLLLLDDLDRALHPRAQRTLAAQIKRLQKLFGTQIVATTHSPYLVDSFDAESVVVLGREGAAEGPIVAHRLADHPDADLLDTLQTGEFWMVRGERGWESEPPAARAS